MCIRDRQQGMSLNSQEKQDEMKIMQRLYQNENLQQQSPDKHVSPNTSQNLGKSKSNKKTRIFDQYSPANILENQPLVNEIIFNKKNPNEISPKTANFGQTIKKEQLLPQSEKYEVKVNKPEVHYNISKYMNFGIIERLNIDMLRSSLRKISQIYSYDSTNSPFPNYFYSSLHPFSKCLLLNNSEDLKISVQQKLVEKDQLYILLEITITNFTMNYLLENITLKIQSDNQNQFKYHKQIANQSLQPSQSLKQEIIINAYYYQEEFYQIIINYTVRFNQKLIKLLLPSSLISTLNIKKIQAEEFKNKWKIAKLGASKETLVCVGPLQLDKNFITKAEDLLQIFRDATLLSSDQKILNTEFIKIGFLSKKIFKNKNGEFLCRIIYQKFLNSIVIQFACRQNIVEELKFFVQNLCFLLMDKNF
eukprot:TRINITY_DN11006_c0_g1_i4.p1 TRINITY_DN11006_c0_g1~~TRINITY_DN11006_c0_g1_i4.p1  ORF type:complete len:420 (+),score=66.78 TRINITY_DN11006_c0_g1_i4:185-1444(+)